jgi:xanthine dehydrogenase small subunit
MAPLQFILNGKPCSEESAPPTTTVLDWLRSRARLTGTKEGCAEGDCGACTIVLGRCVDGRLQYQAVNSCLMMLPQIDGCAVITVEGLSAEDGSLHPVQQALVDAHATQCGFCTPGFVMAMFAFQQGGEPQTFEQATDTLIHEALAGNLCRCTGYRSIVEACRRVAIGPADRFGGRGTAADTLSSLTTSRNYHLGDQVFLQPRSLDELFVAMEEFPRALLLAGGTDLGLRVSKDRERFPAVIATGAVEELRRVATDAEGLVLGGAVTYTQALPSIDRYFSSFGALIRRIGSRQIRNLGTIAGNLATASPIGDTIPCLIALGACVRLLSRAGKRTMTVEEFITGYRETALLPGEIIADVRIPLLSADQTFCTYKVSKRFDQDISTVIAAFKLEREETRVRELHAAFGGMAERAKSAAHLEEALEGRAWKIENFADIDAILARDFAPITDCRGSAAYRLRVASNLVRRFALETASDIPLRLEAL